MRFGIGLESRLQAVGASSLVGWTEFGSRVCFGDHAG
jgi:hypothetical protein